MLLTTISTLNYLDRQIVNILVEPIKRDLRLSEAQLRIRTGLEFALFYSVLGLPIARLADRSYRPAIIAAALFVWSGSVLSDHFVAEFGAADALRWAMLAVTPFMLACQPNDLRRGPRPTS